MDVVAHAGAVGRVVVAAEDLQELALAHRDLGDVGHQVVRDAARVLAEGAAGVRAHRVEVAQVGDRPARGAALELAQHLLAQQLGHAVGVGAGQRAVLGDGQALGLAVDGGRGAEDQRLHALALHRGGHADQAAEVVAEVLERLGHRFAHRLVRGEVHDALHAVAGDDVGHAVGVVDIGLLEDRLLAQQGFQALQHDGRAVGEVVDAQDTEARLLQRDPGVGGDVAGGSGQQDGRHGMCSARSGVGVGLLPCRSPARSRQRRLWQTRMAG